MEEYEDAIDAYDKALEHNPDKIQAWYDKGDILDELECYPEALEAYENGIALVTVIKY